MSEPVNGEAGPELDRASRIRLALSAVAVELADRAARIASTAHDGRPGDVTAAARTLVARADAALQLAVLYDRCRSASWTVIGEALGEVTKQTAHERFAAVERQVDEAITEHWLTGDPRTAGLPEGADADPRTIAKLDRWAAARPRDGAPGDDPNLAVSAGLSPMTTTQHGEMLAAAATLLLKHAVGDPIRRHALELGYARRRVEWYERLLTDEQAEPGSTGTPVPDLREGLAGARARLTEIEGQEPPTGHPIP